MNAWVNLLDMSADADINALHGAMAAAGDGVLTRINHHVESNNFHLNEQLDKNTGSPMAAGDLTWSYGATLKAIKARSLYYA